MPKFQEFQDMDNQMLEKYYQWFFQSLTIEVSIILPNYIFTFDLEELMPVTDAILFLFWM